ncbi:hypothetical protein ACFWNT_12935 [Streptomyces sp. NPDC058409]|uniref:hypothetical protein n=1 Tax=Streptomyces sp. NPDC058409 TaxID=3346484 RepID=UPI00364E202B
MTAPDGLPLHALAEHNLAAASPDLLRAMVKTFADALMTAEADSLCGDENGQWAAVSDHASVRPFCARNTRPMTTPPHFASTRD